MDGPHQSTDAGTRPAPGEVPGRFSRDALARELNPRQLEAVLHPAGPLLVVAGAGSGKTRVITYRLARLLAAGADPRRVLAVTFTNKAAAEMKERVARLVGREALGGLWLGTFHALGARMLRRWGEAIGMKRDFVIYDDDDQRRLMTRVLEELSVPVRLFPVRQVLGAIDRAKNEDIGPERFDPSGHFDEVVARAYGLYERRLREANAIDFGGLLTGALRLCQQASPAAAELHGRFEHVLVDEFQDTNGVQYRLVRFLSGRTRSITVVGDEDQSIYRWRGADIRNILDFERDHPGAGLVKLEQNYRSTARILRAANAVIERNTERRPKRLFTTAGEGESITAFEGETERDEAEFVATRIVALLDDGFAPREIAVFFRTNAQSRVLEEALRVRDLAYIVVGGTRFYDRAEIKDLIAYLRLVQNPDDAMALERIVNVPARGIGDTTVDRIAALSRERALGASAALAEAVADPAVLGPGPRRKVAAFLALMDGLRQAAVRLPPAELAEHVLEASGMRDVLAAEASLEAEGRIENLLELVGQMRDYEREAEEPTLAEFLERVALVSDVDGYDPERGAVSLMTVHTAKGLEFPAVFVTGLEEGVFPHARSIDDDSAIEEERRLCYVALTRAMRRLFVSRVRVRRLSGQVLGGVPSRFLRDLPADAIESLVQPRPAYEFEDTRDAGPWGGRWNRGGARRRSGGADRPASREPGQFTVEYDDGHSPEAPIPGLRVGARLAHPRFGVGEVRAWQGTGENLKVTMRFAGAGMKTILARFLRHP